LPPLGPTLKSTLKIGRKRPTYYGNPTRNIALKVTALNKITK